MGTITRNDPVVPAATYTIELSEAEVVRLIKVIHDREDHDTPSLCQQLYNNLPGKAQDQFRGLSQPGTQQILDR